MKDSDYKYKLEMFKASCRIYGFEKRQVMLIPVQVSSSEPLMMQRNKYMIEDVNYVENMFAKIKRICGPGAAVQLWMIFVEEKTQNDVAYQMGVTPRTVQYSVEKWLRMVFAEEADVER